MPHPFLIKQDTNKRMWLLELHDFHRTWLGNMGYPGGRKEEMPPSRPGKWSARSVGRLRWAEV